MTPLENDENLDFEIVVADGGADSGACYKLYDELQKERGESQTETIVPQTVKEALTVLRNDLFEASCKINPKIRIAYDDLKAKGFDKVVMTGSGSAVVVFLNE